MRIKCEQLLKMNGFEPAGFEGEKFFYEKEGFFGRIALTDKEIILENMVADKTIAIPLNLFALVGLLILGGVIPANSFNVCLV